MDLATITPMILTFNEQANIADTLSRLAWARRIVVIDSYSTDDTLSIIGKYSNVEVIQRTYDHFSSQCNFGLSTIDTDWVLSLDADYKCPVDLENELLKLVPSFAGYRVRFQYCMMGRPLRSTLYPPRTVLYKKELANYARDGHAHRVHINGDVGDLASVISHDDQKPLSSWLTAQQAYARDEAVKLNALNSTELGWKDRIRKCCFAAPLLTGLYCYFGKRLAFDGVAGLYYTYQRVYAEVLLSLELLDRRLRK